MDGPLFIKKEKRTLYFILGAAILLIITATSTFAILSAVLYEPTIAEEQITSIQRLEPESPTILGSRSKMLLVGTTFWGRRTNKLARASNLGIAYPFSQLNTLNRGEYDAWIGGLECPITDNGHTDYNEDKLLKFNCDPDYLPEAAKYFTAFLLGTNHTDNWGIEGFAQTKTNLDQHGIQYFGHYDRTSSTDTCGVIIISTNLEFSDTAIGQSQLPLGFCSYHGVYGVPAAPAMQQIKEYSAVLPTIVMPHMGAEYKSSNDSLRQNLFRQIIDSGAEMVIGDHPHWVQNTEAYNGKLITYSIGNFMFDQQAVETSRSAAIEVNATLSADTDFAAWGDLATACLASKTTCFSSIVAAKLPKLDIVWDFDYHGVTSAETSIPRRASPAEHTAIGERLNWTTTMTALGLDEEE